MTAAGVPTDDPLRGARVALALRDPGPLAAALAAGGAVVTLLDDPGAALLAALGGGLEAIVASLRHELLGGDVLVRVLRDRGDPRLALLLVGDGGEDEEAVRAALEAGADDCLLSPVRPELLRTKLRLTLGARLEETRAMRPPAALDDSIAADPVAPCRFDGHQLLRLIGAGSYGKVYEACSLADGRLVAIKVLCRDVADDRALLARFLREVSALQRVRSPRVVGVRGAGYHRGRFSLVMDLVDGTPATCLPGKARLDVALVVRIAADTCAALEALAAAGLVHRDIKPGNIIVDDDGRATLIDLGLAKPVRCPVEVTGRTELLGTLPYLAPEVVQGSPQTTASDLYALGVTLWELLAFRLPFHGKTELQLLEAIAAGPRAPDVREVRDDVPPQLSTFIARLLEPDASVRLRDPAAARRALQALVPALAG